jgi:hypothetical protein
MTKNGADKAEQSKSARVSVHTRASSSSATRLYRRSSAQFEVAIVLAAYEEGVGSGLSSSRMARPW